MLDNLKSMKDQLINCVQGQLGDISKVDTHELGEAIDMIKDLSQAIYYCTITKSMQKVDQKEDQPINNINYYTTMPTSKYYPNWDNQTSAVHGMDQNVRYYTGVMTRDPREGRSAMRRRMYMQGKEQHKDAKSQLKQLETYLQELSTDITEMIEDASPEERAVLHQKMTTLANKIV